MCVHVHDLLVCLALTFMFSDTNQGNQSGLFDCTWLFEENSLEGLLGSGAHCYWRDRRVLVGYAGAVSAHADSILGTGARLTLKKGN